VTVKRPAKVIVMAMVRVRTTTMRQMRNGQMVMATVVVVVEIERWEELEQVWWNPAPAQDGPL
jgi:hypothetical protein